MANLYATPRVKPFVVTYRTDRHGRRRKAKLRLYAESLCDAKDKACCIHGIPFRTILNARVSS